MEEVYEDRSGSLKKLCATVSQSLDGHRKHWTGWRPESKPWLFLDEQERAKM